MTQFTQKEIEDALMAELGKILGRDEPAITPDTPLHTLGVDSMRFVEMLIFIEKRFGIKLIESGLTRVALQNIHTLAAAIKENLS